MSFILAVYVINFRVSKSVFPCPFMCLFIVSQKLQLPVITHTTYSTILIVVLRSTCLRTALSGNVSLLLSVATR